MRVPSFVLSYSLTADATVVQVTTLGGVQEYTTVTFETDLGVFVNPVAPGVPVTLNMSLFSVAAGFTAW